MIKREKEDKLHEFICRFIDIKVDKPHVGFEQLMEFKQELIENLYLLNESKHRDYLKRAYDRLNFYWEFVDIKNNKNPTTKKELNLECMRQTIQYSIASVDTVAKEFFKGDSDFLYSAQIEWKTDTGDRLSNSETQKIFKDKLTHKQQVLLLKQLGFFELDFFNLLNESQKGVLVSYLLNRDEKNAEDNVRYVRGKRTNSDTNQIYSKTNIKTVNELLEKIGLVKYKVK